MESAGLEFLEGIPGSVGGALRMNAGAMGGAMFDVVRVGSVDEVRRRGQRRDATGNRGWVPQLLDSEDAHRDQRFAAGQTGREGGRGAAHERVQPQALGVAACRAERGMHVQEPADHTRWQVD